MLLGIGLLENGSEGKENDKKFGITGLSIKFD